MKLAVALALIYGANAQITEGCLAAGGDAGTAVADANCTCDPSCTLCEGASDGTNAVVLGADKCLSCSTAGYTITKADEANAFGTCTAPDDDDDDGEGTDGDGEGTDGDGGDDDDDATPGPMHAKAVAAMTTAKDKMTADDAMAAIVTSLDADENGAVSAEEMKEVTTAIIADPISESLGGKAYLDTVLGEADANADGAWD